MRFWKIVYCVLFFCCCSLPFAAMPFAGEEASAENRTLASFPALSGEDGVNVDFLSEAGDYFQDHFAFRNELVTAQALLQGRVLGTSSADGVIQGEDGWLYYRDSLDDYLGTGLLSDRSLHNIAHSLSMMQETLEKRGISFLFTVAPNKNSLYGEHMPYYDSLVVTKDNNLARLEPLLAAERVHYLSLKDVFEGQDEVLYHARDSHWNNKGAALAAGKIMEALGKEHDSYDGETYTVRKDFTGDLDGMLYPLAMTAEEEVYYDKIQTFAYVGEVESNFDPRITTVNPVKAGSLVMYRDSFGNTLLPFFADAYASAYFSRGEPYQVSTDTVTAAADTVVVERAERFLPNVAANPPVLANPQAVIGEAKEVSPPDGGGEAGEAVMRRQGLYFQISGWAAPEYLDEDSPIYVKLNDSLVFEAYPATLTFGGQIKDGGFVLYISTEELPMPENTVEIITEKGGELLSVWKGTVAEEAYE